MVTAPLLSQGIDVNLPQTKAPEVKRTENDLILTLKPKGKITSIFVNDQKSPIASTLEKDQNKLEDTIKELLAGHEKKDLFLRADKSIPYGEVARVMATAKLAGVERIGMMTNPTGK